MFIELRKKMLVTVKPGAKEDKIVKEGSGYKVWLKARPVDGKANEALVKLFKKKLGLRVKVKSGFTSRKKVLEVLAYQ